MPPRTDGPARGGCGLPAGADAAARRVRAGAIVTGASSGIGYNLAKCAAENGYDLIVAADQPLDEAAGDFKALGAQVEEFFARADMLDTKVGTDDKKMDPAEVARIGFKAMEDGEADVVAGFKNKMMVAMSKLMPSQMVADQHRKMAKPGTANP